jgi:hypothetical protein
MLLIKIHHAIRKIDGQDTCMTLKRYNFKNQSSQIGPSKKALLKREIRILNQLEECNCVLKLIDTS